MNCPFCQKEMEDRFRAEIYNWERNKKSIAPQVWRYKCNSDNHQIYLCYSTEENSYNLYFHFDKRYHIAFFKNEFQLYAENDAAKEVGEKERFSLNDWIIYFKNLGIMV